MGKKRRKKKKRTQHLFMIKSHNKLGTEGNFPNLKEGHSPKGHHP